MNKIRVTLSNPATIFMDTSQPLPDQILTGVRVLELNRSERVEESLRTGQIKEVKKEEVIPPKVDESEKKKGK